MGENGMRMRPFIVRPWIQLVLLGVCWALFGFAEGLLWFFVVYMVLCLLPAILVALFENRK